MQVKNILRLLAVAVFAVAPVSSLSAQPDAPIDGYPVANFAVTANVSADGDLFGRVLHNRGKLGRWLTDLGALRLSLVKEGTAYPLSSYPQREVRRAFPFVTADLSGHEAIRSSVHYEVWAPVGIDNLDVTALPVLQLELTLTNPSGPAINLQNGKRCEVTAKKGTSSTLTDGANDDYNGCYQLPVKECG